MCKGIWLGRVTYRCMTNGQIGFETWTIYLPLGVQNRPQLCTPLALMKMANNVQLFSII